MFDTMTFTKIMGGFCGALLVFLLGKWAADEIYAVGDHYGDHSPAYVIDTGTEEVEEVEEEVITLASLYADADPEAGARVFNKCSACHKIEDGANGVGPHLYGVVGRDIGSVDAYAAYSGALSEAADVWTAENLYAFLEDPSGWAPGTSMGYAGLKKPEDRADVIAYLDMSDGDMTELAAAEAAPEPAAEEAAPEPAATEETAPEEAASEDAATEEVVTEDAATEEAVTEDAATEEAAADESATEETVVAEAAPEAEAAPAAAEASGFAALVAAADPADGEKVYRQCAACHVVDDEVNRVGPHLLGVVGRDIGAVESYNYSDALAGHGGVWDADALNAWLEDSNAFIPGNKMSYRGLRDEEDRAAVIKYMQSVAE